jgi:hypothetical protein
MLLLAVSVSILTMGTCYSKNDKVKRNKDHNRQKMFRFGISFGRNDLNLEGHFQMGYNSKTIIELRITDSFKSGWFCQKIYLQQ